MNTLQLLLISAFLIIVILLIITIVQTKSKIKLKQLKENEIQNYFKEKWKEGESNLSEKLKEKEKEVDKLDISLNLLKKELEEKEERYKEVNRDLDKYKIDRKKEIDEFITQEREDKFNNLGDWVRIEEEKEKERLSQLRNKNEEALKKEKEIYEVEIKEIKEELEDIRSRRAAINEEIRRQREINDKEEFYHIQLDKNLISDIALLRSIAPRLVNPASVNKLIWQAYYQKPLAELRKRLLPNGDYSGIYKITRDKTGEVYIGQTTSLDKRLQDHCKSALGVGTLASSTLHRLMREDGLENFSFEIIEKVEKDKLKEKESFYIDFYDSKNYGMNSISGVKNETK